ncbi:hypothetical protein D3C85_985850 [compost metagenome]
MYPYIVGLYHLPTAEGLVGLFHRAYDFLHGYQFADFFFGQQQCFHLYDLAVL